GEAVATLKSGQSTGAKRGRPLGETVTALQGEQSILAERSRQLAEAVGALQVEATERRRVEQALRESEARYRAIVDSQTDLICRYLPDPTITFVNEAYCRYFGRSRDQLIGRRFLELIPEPSRAAAERHVASLIENPRVVMYEHESLLADGSLGWQ